MDELSALPPEGGSRRKARLRTSSTGLRSGYAPSSSPVSTRADSPVNTLRPSASMPRRTPDRLEIHAPTPRRHLLESSASQHWLRTPPLSPVSSRGASPVYAVSTSTAHHKPRHSTITSTSTSFSALLEQQRPRPAKAAAPEDPDTSSMGRRWIRWMHRRNMRGWVVPAAVGCAVLVKSALGLGSYSGHGTPPMYGDFEAQRHWMELTLHLPMREWYTYDLQYWGLDYPPLTAYVSWVCGLVGVWVEPSWFALGASRGIETQGSKVFMRATVVVMDLVVYVPALLMFAATWQGSRSKRTQGERQHIALLTLLFQPALLLIDSGHFQYNSVMLGGFSSGHWNVEGLTLLALNFFATGQDLLGAVCFVLSLGFKQMALYYAPAIGSYLLAKCIYMGPSRGLLLNSHSTRHFIRLAGITTLTSLFLFLPFLPPFGNVLDPLSRIFPFGRGLFEDKVANFWCASNVVLKWREWAEPSALVRLSAGLTALGFAPGVGVMLQAGWKFRVKDGEGQEKEKDMDKGKKGTKQAHAPFLPLLPYALLNSSMSFFLFSFQVHEKTILLPLLPITLLLSGSHVDSAVYSWGVLVNNVAVFSMWPLLKRDGLGVQYIATLLLWNRLVGYNPFRVPQKSFMQLLSTMSMSLITLRPAPLGCVLCRIASARSGAGGFAAREVPGSVCRVERVGEHARVRAGVVMEYQERSGSGVGARRVRLGFGYGTSKIRRRAEDVGR
ncbi:hypothetical protein DXG01_001899 [Tephrocybe rancida]|nr:hypothetical protein DXG01_001899 [Tephrocybe rancida]